MVIKHAQAFDSALQLWNFRFRKSRPARMYRKIFVSKDQVERLSLTVVFVGVALTGTERAGAAVAAKDAQ